MKNILMITLFALGSLAAAQDTTTPSTPSAPADTTTPSAPADTTTPSAPADTTTPSAPADTTTPVDTTTPSTPTDTTTPADTTTPSTPDDTTTPSTPDDTTAPADTTTPSAPDDTTAPADTTTPSAPTDATPTVTTQSTTAMSPADAFAKAQEYATQADVAYPIPFYDRTLWKAAVDSAYMASVGENTNRDYMSYLGQLYTKTQWWINAYNVWSKMTDLNDTEKDWAALSAAKLAYIALQRGDTNTARTYVTQGLTWKNTASLQAIQSRLP